MDMKAIKKNSTAWVESDPDATPVAGYDAALQAAIAKGKAQLEAGQGIAADQVWGDLGIE